MSKPADFDNALGPWLEDVEGGILVFSSPDLALARGNLAKAAEWIGHHRGEPVRAAAGPGMPGSMSGLLHAGTVALPRAPRDEEEALATVSWAQRGSLILLPFQCSSSDGARSAVRSLVPRSRRSSADDMMLGIFHEDSPLRPGACREGCFVHAKGTAAAGMLVRGGLGSYHGAVIAYPDGFPEMRWQSNPSEVLAWRFSNPELVPENGWKHLGVSLGGVQEER